MTRWKGAAALAIVAGAALAGCVQPEPAPGADTDCEGWSAHWCERAAPEPMPAPLPVPSPCPGWENASLREEHGLCADPLPPVLAPFVARPAGPCAACASVSLAARERTTLLATEQGLRAEPLGEPALQLGPPRPALLPGVSAELTLRAPHVHVDDAGRAWYVALGDLQGAPFVVLGRWDDGATWALERAVDSTVAPMLALVERAWGASSGTTFVLVLATRDAAWALRSHDGGASFLPPEALTPPAGAARFGAPSVDHRGRVLVPFVFDAMALDEALAPLTAAHTPSTLHYAAYADGAGMWTFHGGVPIPQGLAAGSRPAVAGAGWSTAFTWIDAAGAPMRLDVTDDGGGWGQPAFWSVERSRGTPALARDSYAPPCPPNAHCAWQPDGNRLTAAWWQDDGSLVVARALWHDAPTRARIATLAAPAGDAALALLSDGSAVVAWLEEGSVWLATEQRA